MDWLDRELSVFDLDQPKNVLPAMLLSAGSQERQNVEGQDDGLGCDTSGDRGSNFRHL
jgi:hypothetical protein